MIEHVIVVGKVVAGDDVDACIFLDLPVGESESLTLVEQFFLGELVGPVCFGGFLEVTENTLARKAED